MAFFNKLFVTFLGRYAGLLYCYLWQHVRHHNPVFMNTHSRQTVFPGAS